MSTRGGLCNITHALQARVITELSKLPACGCAEMSQACDKSANSEQLRLLLRSSKEPEIVPDLTLKLSLWQRLEWSSRVKRRHQQPMLFDGPPEQLEFEF